MKGLDKYLTQGPPDSPFDSYAESVLDNIPEEVINFEEYEKNQKLIDDKIYEFMEMGIVPTTASELLVQFYNTTIKNDR